MAGCADPRRSRRRRRWATAGRDGSGREDHDRLERHGSPDRRQVPADARPGDRAQRSQEEPQEEESQKRRRSRGEGQARQRRPGHHRSRRTPAGNPGAARQGERRCRKEGEGMMGEPARNLTDLPDDRTLEQIERTAVEIARLAGAEIVTALGGMLAVKYKSDLARKEGDELAYRDPVSEVDHRVEVLLRARIAERFPSHDIIGEEINDRPGDRPYAEYIWAVDPIDGTANFINGFPLFAASIGVLHRGRPVAGAVWCAASHALRAGVYHGHVGGELHFDEV